MSHSLFLPPGEDLFHPRPGLLDLLAARPRMGAIRRPPPAPAEPFTEEAPQPLPHGEAERKREPARLANPRFASEAGRIGEKAAATVEAEFPDPDSPRRVLMELFAVSDDGRRQRIQGHDRPVPKTGRAECEFILHPPDFREGSGDPVSRCDYVFTATHPDAASVESPVLRAESIPEPRFEGLVFYSPSRDEYLVFETGDEAAPLLAEVERLEGLRDRSRLAWAEADPARRTQELRRIARDAEDLFEGKSQGRARAGLEELLLVDNQSKIGSVKGWSYLPDPSDEGKQAWKYGLHRFKRSEIQSRHARLLKQGYTRRRSPLFENRCGFKHNLFAPGGKSEHWIAFRSAVSEKDKEQEAFTWSGEAALGRYLHGWDGGEIAFDARRKSLRVGATGQVGLALFEGAISGTLHLPDPKGMNILGWLRDVKYRDAYLADPSRVCLLRFILKGSMSAYLGGTLQGALAFPSLCFEGQSEGKQKAEVSATVSGFAGGQVKFGARLGIEWSSSFGSPFESLGSLAYEYGVSAGIGGEAGFGIDYQDGRFTFQVSAALAWGLGCKGGFALEIPVAEGWKLVGHVLACLDFHFVREMLRDAYEAYVAQSILFAMAERQRLLAEAEWSRSRGGKARSAYTWFRKWLSSQESGFLQLKLQAAQQTGLRTSLMKMAPEAVGLALMAIMESREATDFEAIMLILYASVGKTSARESAVPPGHKLEWVLRYLSGSDAPERPVSPAWKETSLRKGIQKVRDFGKGKGYRDALGENSAFLRRFDGLLSDQGIEP